MPPRRAISYCSEEPSNLLLVPKSGVGKSSHRDELSARDLRRDGGPEDLHLQSRSPRLTRLTFPDTIWNRRSSEDSIAPTPWTSSERLSSVTQRRHSLQHVHAARERNVPRRWRELDHDGLVQGQRPFDVRRGGHALGPACLSFVRTTVSRASTRARHLILSGSKPFSVTAIFATWTSSEPGLAEVAGAPTTKADHDRLDAHLVRCLLS
jgi:hypothetical protein